jgi:hypothetical protein
MKSGKNATLQQTNAAAIDVQKELYAVGLWYSNSRLYSSNIIWDKWGWDSVPDAHGFFTHGLRKIDRLFGLEEGNIYIPQWVSKQTLWQSRGSLRDIIRHEYGHAFCHHYPELISDSPEFRTFFGGHYYDCSPSKMAKEAYISHYAQCMPMEDFAETFMVYVRRRGILPSTITHKALIAKWKFIKKAIRQV